MRLRRLIAVLILVLAPASAVARSHNDAFANEARQQREARHAAMQERQERTERWQEWQREHEIDHPSATEDDDNADDDPYDATPKR